MGNNTRVDIKLEDGERVNYTIPSPVKEVIGNLAREGIPSILVVHKYIQYLLSPKEIREVCLNASAQVITVIFSHGENEAYLCINLRESKIEITSDLIAFLSGGMGIIVRSSLIFFPFVKNSVTYCLPKIMNMSLSMSIYPTYYYIYLSLLKPQVVDVDCILDVPNYKCVAIDKRYNVRIEVDFKKKLISHENGISSLNGTHYDFLVDPQLKGLKTRVIYNWLDDCLIKEWIEGNIAYRRIIVKDFYTNESIGRHNMFIKAYVNDTLKPIDTTFITLVGTVKVIILSGWGDKLYELVTPSDMIIVYVKIGMLLVVNQLNITINVTVISEGGVSRSSKVCPGEVYSTFLTLNLTYVVEIWKEGEELLNKTIILHGNNTRRPMFVMVVSEKMAINARSLEEEKKEASHETNRSFIFVLLDYLTKYYWVLLICGAFFGAIKMIKKARAKKTIEVEELLRSIITESDE